MGTTTLAWPHPTSHPPLRPQPTNLSTSCRKAGAGEGPDLSSKFQRAAKGWKRPRKPGGRPLPPPPPPPPGCPSPAPLLGGRTRRGSPRPRAVRRLAQGASFLKEISRKSAGPLASGSPPNPAGALSAAAPPHTHSPEGETGRGRGAALYCLFSPQGERARVALGAAGPESSMQGPNFSGRSVDDKHLSHPPPTTGIHVLHILGRLEAGGGVSCRDWWGTDGEPHPVHPLSSSVLKWGPWEESQVLKALPYPAGLHPQPTCSLPSVGAGQGVVVFSKTSI